MEFASSSSDVKIAAAFTSRKSFAKIPRDYRLMKGFCILLHYSFFIKFAIVARRLLKLLIDIQASTFYRQQDPNNCVF